MKIVYLIDYIYAPGGMERMLVNKANAFVERGIDVSVITCVPKSKKHFFTLDPRVKVYDTGVEYDLLEKYGGLKKAFVYKRLNNRHRRVVTKLLNEIKPDIAISMHKGERRFLPFIKDGSRKMLEIHYDRNAAIYGHNKFRFTNIFRLRVLLKSLFTGTSFNETVETGLISHYDDFIVLTEEDREQWGNLPNITVIPNFLTCETKRAPLDDKRVIAVGRLNVVKGFDMLIDCWAEVMRRTDGQWKLDIYGDGDLRGILLEQIESLGLTESVSIHPATADIIDKYAESSVFVLTSRSEGFPMVLLEALSCGLPGVAFACKCGPRDMIEDGCNGFLIENVGDTVTMAGRITELMENETERKSMGQSALESAGRFSKESVVDRWIELFNKNKK